MSQRRMLFAAALLAAFTSFASPVFGQGTTTGAVSGTITSTDGSGIEGAQVQVINRATGYSTGSLSRANGLYMVSALEVGGPYSVRIRRIGFQPVDREGIIVSLGRSTRVDVALRPQATVLGAVTTTAEANAAEFSPSRQGVGTVMTDTIIRRIPTLQRDFIDLVKLTPQAVPTSGGPSAGGVYNRLNNITVDGANQNDRFNLGASGGIPGGGTNGRIMSVEAVKEFQVLLSPTDVRYGNFAGMIINAVTKGGTNEFHGGATYTFRTPGMARNVDQIRTSGFEIRQHGFHLGGPIIKDKLHFFVAPEWQERTNPTTGPIIDAATNTIGTSTVKVSLDSINRIASLLAPRFDVGSAGAFPLGNPLKNLMARLDWSINEENRLQFRVLDNTSEVDEFGRSTSGLTSSVLSQSSGIRLTSNAYLRQGKNRSWAAQLFTNLPSGLSNEFLFGYNTIQEVRILPINAPEISIGVTPVGGTTPSVAVTVGSERFSPNNLLRQKIVELSNNLTKPIGAHTITLGGRWEYTDLYNYFLSGAGNGAWTFPTIAALQANAPSGYAFTYANGGDIAAKFDVQQFSAYLQDLWHVTSNFSVTAGLRVDVPYFFDTPKRNIQIPGKTAAYRNDVKPETRALWSPRLGFNWDKGGTQTTQIRGNVGVFTGQTPYILLGNAYSGTGLGGVTVGCTGTATPPFSTDVATLPQSCAGLPAPAKGAAGTVGINVNDPGFRYPQNLTTSLGLDQRLPWGFLATFEGLYRKDINGLLVRDVNLRGPRMVGGQIYRDRHGRVLYADTMIVGSTGSVTVTNTNKHIISIGSPAVTFTEGAIMLTNSKAGHSYSLSSKLTKRWSRAFEFTAAYTYMQAKDVMSLTSDRAISNWRGGRQHAGLEYDPNDAQTSEFQRPHRMIAFGTYTAPWRRFQTDLSFYYEGVSGSTMSFVTNNDINGDGSTTANDMIYVPLDATDPTEIRIGSGAGTAFVLDPVAAAAFERYIELQPCLDDQRGKIATRNSCQGPFQRRMDFSLRQTLPEVLGQRLTAQLDIFNFLNFMNKNWGQLEFPVSSSFNRVTALQTAGRSGPLNTGHWNYNVPTAILNSIKDFDSPFALNPNSVGNNYQMQLTFRYSF